jgi:hypothetical protein
MQSHTLPAGSGRGHVCIKSWHGEALTQALAKDFLSITGYLLHTSSAHDILLLRSLNSGTEVQYRWVIINT